MNDELTRKLKASENCSVGHKELQEDFATNNIKLQEQTAGVNTLKQECEKL